MDRADLTFGDIRMLLDLLKHRCVCLSQEVGNRLKGSACPAMNRKMDIRTDDNGLSSTSTNLKRSSDIKHTAHF